MDRRTFLKTLVALGASLPLPLDLVLASDREINESWKKARDILNLFEVQEGGVLSFANYENLARGDAYFLSGAAEISVEDIEYCPPLQWKVSDLCLEDLEGRDWEGIAQANWAEWFRDLQGQRRDTVLADLDDWLNEEPDWDEEADHLPNQGTASAESKDRHRAAAYGLPEAAKLTVGEISRCCPLQWRVSELYLQELEGCDWESIAQTDWANWFQSLHGQSRDEVYAELDAWLCDEPDWAWEEDYLPDSATGQGAAFGYFNDANFSMLDALKIEVVEGDRPGSNYVAAELHMPVDEANAVAENNGWAIRFVEEGEA
jgi:hypothetical protein